jgi:signal transduction histidine kinase
MMQHCPWEAATYLGFYSSNVPTLLYYSHIPALIVALFWGYFIFMHAHKDAKLYSLVLIFLSFAVWNVFDLLLWATNRPDITLFFWSLQIMLEALTFMFAFNMVYSHVNKRELSNLGKSLIALITAPFLLLIPTSLNLIGVNLADCTAIESVVARYYSYFLEATFIIAISIVALEGYRKATDRLRKREILYFSLGVFLFLMMFIYGNLIGSFLDNWTLAQYGLFGMPVFVTLLVYTIVRFKSFSMKLLGAQALVMALVILIGSQFFFIKSPVNRLLNGITLALSVGFGVQLVRSVKREVEAKELIERQKEQLEKANARLKELDIQKTEFVSFATHQLRSPLTSIRGNASLILEGDLGPVSEQVKSTIQLISTSIKTMINVVEDYLNISRIELGTMKYDLRDMELKDMLKEVINEQKSNIEDRKLAYSVAIDESQTYKVKADPDKFKQVVMNTIDNSIKYTPEGSIAISLEKADGKVRIKVSDTGVGIRPDVIPKLFQKFSRAPKASEANIHGTGLGLYIAKEIMNAHGGKIWAESEGEGKGSQFYIELPEAKQ